MHWLFSIRLFNESPLCLEAPCCESLSRIFREAWLVYDYQMQLVFEEVRALRATMPIIDGKVATLGPLCHIFPRRWPSHVQYDTDNPKEL